jgi:hypothetical protein
MLALLAVTVAPAVVTAVPAPVQNTPAVVVRPVYAAFYTGTWTLGPNVGYVVYNTQTCMYMVVAGGLAQPPPGGSYDALGLSTGPIPPSSLVYFIGRLDVNSQGGTLKFGQSPWSPTTINPFIANGGVFVIFVSKS